MELSAFQVGCLEECILDVGRDLTTDCFEDHFCKVRVIYQLGGVLL
jgi:hypothetical protein